MERHPQCRQTGSRFCPQCGYRQCLAVPNQAEMSWQTFFASDKTWLADHGQKMGPGVGQQVVERLLVALNYVAPPSPDLRAQLAERAGEVTITRERYEAYQKAEAECERLKHMIANPPKHVFWGAGEPDCHKEIKAGNGELHTVRCKRCGLDNPRNPMCLADVPDADWTRNLNSHLAEKVRELTAQRDGLVEAGKPFVEIARKSWSHTLEFSGAIWRPKFDALRTAHTTITGAQDHGG